MCIRDSCYGETGHDYTAAAEELEVLYGWQVEVVPITADDLQRLLLQHYRQMCIRDRASPSAPISRFLSE